MIEESVPKGKESTFQGISKSGLNQKDLQMLKWREKGGEGCFNKYMRCCGVICEGCYMPCFCCYPVAWTTIHEGHEGLYTEFGKFIKKVGPGIHSYNPVSQKVDSIDCRAQIYNIPVQQQLTRDNVQITVDAFCQYKILLAELAHFRCKSVGMLINYMVQGTMKAIYAENSLKDLLVNRKTIEKKITEHIDQLTDPYGVKVQYIGSSKLQLPTSMINSMSTIAESEKQKEAKMIDASASLESAESWKLAADELSKNKNSITLKYYEILKFIATNQNSTLVLTTGSF